MKRYAVLATTALVIFLSLTGCKPEAKVTKSDEDKIRAPLGQPMPEEARKAMARANASAASKAGKTR